MFSLSHCVLVMACFAVCLGNFGEVIHVELAMDRAVSCFFSAFCSFLALLVKKSAHHYFDINRLIFQKDMLMLSTRQELMLRKRSCLWMVYVSFRI